MLSQIAPFDLFVIVFLLVAALWGGIKGMISQIASIFALVGSWYLAERYSSSLLPHIPLEEPLNETIAYLATLVVSGLVLKIVFFIICRPINHGIFKEFNRQMGALFGLLKGIVICLIITIVAVMASDLSRKLITDSQSGRLMIQLIVVVQEYVPDNEQHQKIREILENFTKKAGLSPDEKNALSNEIEAFKASIAQWVANSSLQKNGSGENDEASKNLQQVKKTSSSLRVSDETLTPEESKEPAVSFQWGGGEKEGEQKMAVTIKNPSGILAAAQKIFTNDSARSLLPTENSVSKKAESPQPAADVSSEVSSISYEIYPGELPAVSSAPPF